MVAGTQWIKLPEQVHKVACVHHRTVRPEITRPVLNHPPCQEHLREIIRSHTYPGISLGILEQYIVFGLVLLDEVVLQKKRVRLGVHDRELSVRNPGDKKSCLAVQPFRIHEILRHPLMEVLGLSHVYHRSLGVIITVDSGGMREKGYFFSDFQLIRVDFSAKLTLFHRKAITASFQFFAASILETSSMMASPRRSLRRIVPSGPKRIR